MVHPLAETVQSVRFHAEIADVLPDKFRFVQAEGQGLAEFSALRHLASRQEVEISQSGTWISSPGILVRARAQLQSLTDRVGKRCFVQQRVSSLAQAFNHVLIVGQRIGQALDFGLGAVFIAFEPGVDFEPGSFTVKGLNGVRS